METKKILTGSLIAAAILNVASVEASNTNLFGYTSLGTGAEVRNVVLNGDVSAVKFSDFCCGYNTKKIKRVTKKEQRKAKWAKVAHVKHGKKVKDSAPKSETKKV